MDMAFAHVSTRLPADVHGDSPLAESLEHVEQREEANDALERGVRSGRMRLGELWARGRRGKEDLHLRGEQGFDAADLAGAHLLGAGLDGAALEGPLVDVVGAGVREAEELADLSERTPGEDEGDHLVLALDLRLETRAPANGSRFISAEGLRDRLGGAGGDVQGFQSQFSIAAALLNRML